MIKITYLIKDVQMKENENCIYRKYLNEHLSDNDRYKIIEIELTAESFLYKMIRKLVGVCVMVAMNRLDLKTIDDMFSCPPDHYHNNNMLILGPSGLTLKDVDHDLSTADYTDEDYMNYLNYKKEINIFEE